MKMSVKETISNIKKFLSVVKKPNVVPITGASLKSGLGCIAMWDSDAPEERTLLRFPITNFDENVKADTLILQDRMDIMYFFDAHSESPGLLGVCVDDMKEMVFFDTIADISFIVEYKDAHKSHAVDVLVADMLKTGKKNLDTLYQSLVFDKIVPKEKEDKK